MKIVVNDANILIDFCKLDLLEAFFLLPYDFHVVDAVWDELNSQQQEQLQPHIQSERLVVIRDAVEITEVIQIRRQRNQLSIPDCTANQTCRIPNIGKIYTFPMKFLHLFYTFPT